MTYEKAKEIFEGHKQTGEPLSDEEVEAIVQYGLAGPLDFDHTGGGCFRYNGPEMRPEDYEPEVDEDHDGLHCSVDAAEYYHEMMVESCPCDPELGEHAPH